MVESKKNLSLLYLLGFILAVSTALPSYIQSTFIQNSVGLRWVSLFFGGAMVATLVATIYFPHLIRKFTNYYLALALLVINFISIPLMVTIHSVFWFFIFFISFTVSINLIWINMDMFVETYSLNKNTGAIRTTYFTLMNLGWMVSPLAVGYLLRVVSYGFIFWLAALFLIPAFLIFLSQKARFRDQTKYEKGNVKAAVVGMWCNSSLRLIFFVSFLLRLFYTFAVVYVPIYLNQNLGFSWSVIGIMFTFMLMPFVLLEIPAGLLADKYLGEKEILIVGFSILVITTFLMFFTHSVSPIVWGLILFFSRCGAALVEAMQETYFFKIVDVPDVNFINLFRTANPLSYLAASALAALLLVFFPIHYLFLFLAIILLSGIYFACRLKDTA